MGPARERARANGLAGRRAAVLVSGARPHFEQLCRQFAATTESFGALPGEVGSGVVLSLGEAKWGKPLGASHLERLRRARDLLAARGYDTRGTVLACYGGAGFDPDLPAAASGDRILTVSLDDLYAD